VIVAGTFCGVAFSTHYYAVFLAVPLTLSVVWAWRHRGWRSTIGALAAAGGAAALVFFALSPFLIVEPRTAWQDIVANRQIVVDRAVTMSHGAFSSATAYARLLWTEGTGWPVLLVAFAGLIRLATERWRDTVWLLAFPVPFLAFIANTVAAGRYLNPVLPFVAMAAAYAVTRAARVAGSRAGWLAAVMTLSLAVPALRLSIATGRFFSQTDTRTLAQQFIQSNVPAGSTVLVQPYSVQLIQSRESLVEALTANLGSPARASTKFALRLGLSPYPSPAYRTLYLGDGGLDADKIYVSLRQVDGSAGLEPLTRLGVEYVVLKRYNTEDLAVAPLRAMLSGRGRLVASFSPYRPDADSRTRARVAPFLHNTDTPYDRALERPGPGLELWALPTNSVGERPTG
jgi:hypothetical protein